MDDPETAALTPSLGSAEMGAAFGRGDTLSGPDWKPTRRVRLGRSAYAELSREILSEWPRCACGCLRFANTLHHVVGGNNRSDVREALVGLAGDGVRLCHGAITSKQNTWDDERETYIEPEQVAAGIRQHMETERPEVLAYVLAVKGADFLDRAYSRR